MSTKASAPEPTGPVPFLNHPNVIRPFGYSSMECGYCKGARSSVVSKTPKDCSKSFGILAEAMTPKVYEELVYRGWRRSGIHLYKPSNFESCCPTLTIRLLADQFQPSKSQMKTQRKFRQLLVPPEQGTKIQPVQNNKSNNNYTNSLHTQFESYLNEKTPIMTNLASMIRQALLESQVLPAGLELPSISFKVRPISPRQEMNRELIMATTICAQLSGKAKIPREPLLHSVVAYWQKLQPTNTMPIQSVVAHEKSGQILVTVQLSMDLWDEVTKPQDYMTVDLQDNPNENDKLGDWYREMTGKRLKQGQRKLRIETFPSHQSALEPQVHRLYVQYQHVVHDDPDPFQDQENEDTTTVIKKGGEEGESSLLDSIESMIANLDWGPHCPLHFQTHVRAMLKEYLAPHPLHVQRALLNNYYGFYQFLVESPFDNQGDCGTYHQQYWIGDVLIAVGVVDVLPQGLSSVYLYYHPGMAHSLVPLGKLAILEEIEYTRKVLKRPYYYLGYYIESCTKMRYKAEYHPSQLLCPVHYEWIDCHVAIPKLQQTIHHVCPLVDDDGEKNNKSQGPAADSIYSDSTLSLIPMDIGAGMAVTMDMLQENGKQVVRPILEEFLIEAGLEIGQQCLVKLT